MLMRWYVTDYVFLGSIVVFLATEGYALFNKTEGDTFSEMWWAWLKGKTTRHPKPVIVETGRAGDNSSPTFKGMEMMVHEPIRVYTRFTKLAGRRKTDLVAYHGIKLNTFRWFATAWLSLGLFAWLWLHLNFGLFAGG
jgi:hypothetical protein